MKSIIASVAATVLCVGVAHAQDFPTDRSTIVVVGVGEAERAADTFAISASIEGRGSDQVSALRALSTTQARVTEGLLGLRGITRGEITTGTLEVQPTFGPDCRASRYDDTSDCAPSGYVATNALTFEGGPVDRAGDAVSLASELGAVDASFSGGSLLDREALEAEARAAAYTDAVRQAEALAQASGQRLVRPLRVMPEDYRGNMYSADAAAEIVVTGSRVPAVRLDVAPPPVRATTRLSVMFETE